MFPFKKLPKTTPTTPKSSKSQFIHHHLKTVRIMAKVKYKTQTLFVFSSPFNFMSRTKGLHSIQKILKTFQLSHI